LGFLSINGKILQTDGEKGSTMNELNLLEKKEDIEKATVALKL
jgi:hypothetical protein